MKKIILILAVQFLIIMNLPVSAQAKQEVKNQKAELAEKKPPESKESNIKGKHFVDKNGDGYNDNAPDDDGDGIPNCIDPDYKGGIMQKGKKGFIDLNGDGINDNAGKGKMGMGNGKGAGMGMGNKLGPGKGKNK